VGWREAQRDLEITAILPQVVTGGSRVNEGLGTVNAELHNTVEETTKAVDDLGNLIASTGIATVFVDRSMRIARYTTPAVELFNLIDSDGSRPLLRHLFGNLMFYFV
jgi:hypothetical protein